MRVRLLLLLSRRGGGGGCEIIDFGSSDFATLHFTLRPQRTHKNTLGLGRNQITANNASSKIFYTQRDDFHQRKK